MSPRNAPPSCHGLLLIDKPLGTTSTQVVRIVKRLAQRTRTGHAGTLDPLATGLLICCLGRATKTVPQLMAMTKQYRTTIDLSAWSTTDDAEGEKTPHTPDAIPDEPQVRTALQKLIGHIEQTPPVYSAIKVQGRRAYDLARKGQKVELKSRIVRIDRIDLLHYAYPHLTLEITCGQGTYIRSLARQIGERICTAGYLTELRRTAIGPYHVDQASAPDDLPNPIAQDHLLDPP